MSASGRNLPFTRHSTAQRLLTYISPSRSLSCLYSEKMSKSLLVLALFASSIAMADEAQVLLRSDKIDYARGESVNLFYETLWLGSEDGQMRFSSTAFPEIEVLYLNEYLVELTESAESKTIPAPSHHEKSTFAPTMSHLSKEFAINDAGDPTTFLDGTVGFYQLDRPGVYVIRALFRANTDWHLYEGQDVDVYSTRIVIRVRE